MVSDARLAHYQGITALTTEDLTKIIATLWPGAPKVEQQKAIMLCQQYRLNPLLNHIAIVEFKGKHVLIPEIKATRVIVTNNGGPYSYADGPRMMTKQEVTDIIQE